MKGIDPHNASFFEHLEELRARLIRCVVLVLIGTIVAFSFKEQLFRFFMIPIQPLIAKEPGLLAVLSPLEMFIVYLKLSLVAGDRRDLPDHLVPGLVIPCPSLARERTARRLPVLVLRQRSVCARRCVLLQPGAADGP